MGTELFRRTVKGLKLRSKNLNHIVLDNIEERKSFLKLEKFLSKTTILVSPTFDSYITEHRPIKKVVIVLLMKTAAILFLLRYLLSIIFIDNHFISVVLLSNANHILGSKFLTTCAFFGGHLTTFTLSSIVQYFDMTSKLTVVEYMYEIKNLIIGVRLYGNYRTKYYKKMDMITKHLSWPMLSNMVLNGCVIIIGPPIVGYFTEPEMGYSLLSIIFWTPITFLAIVDFNATVLGVFRFWFLSLTYLRYQFKQVNERIENSIKSTSFEPLRRAMADHNYCCLRTKKLNQTFNYLIYILYLMGKPTINMLIYISHAKGTHELTRIGAALPAAFSLLAIFAVNLLCVSVMSWAHKPLTTMYQLFKNKRLRVVHKLKIQGFIENLSETVIGFYCYKIYPMNNYEFSRSILEWACNYFLLIELINDMDLSVLQK